MMDWTRLEFSAPWFAILLFLLPLVFWVSRQSQGRLLYSSLRLIPQHAVSTKQKYSWLPSALMTMGMAFLIVAMTGPRIGNKQTEIKKEGISIMMVVDTSSSMRALDLSTEEKEQDRLAVVKNIFSQFVTGGAGFSGRGNDAIGLVRFAGFADTACPLSLEHNGLLNIIQNMQITAERAEDGTAIGDGLSLAISRIADSKTSSKIIILLTDGENNAGEEQPLVAADVASSQKITIYTIGVGTNGVAPVPVTNPRTGETQLRAMSVHIDEELLTEIAERTGGQYFRATDQESLAEIVKEIDSLEKTEIAEKRYRQYSEYFSVLASLGLLFLCLGFVADATIFRRFP